MCQRNIYICWEYGNHGKTSRGHGEAPGDHGGDKGTKGRTMRVQNSNISFDLLQNMNFTKKIKRFKTVNVEKPLVLVWFSRQPRSTQIENRYKTAVEIRIPVKK